jgi:hypothetical protein
MAVNLVLDNGNFSQGGPVLENVLVAAGLRCGSVGVATSGTVTAGGGFGDSAVLNGNPSVPLTGDTSNSLILNGVKQVFYEPSFVSPQTAVAKATLNWSITNATEPVFLLLLEQFSPQLTSSGNALLCYAVVNTASNNSVVVTSTAVNSFCSSQPAGSLAGISGTSPSFTGVAAHTQVAAADVIACPTISPRCALRAWVAGSTGNQLATAVTPPTISNIVPGTGFTLNGTPGVIYGYEVLYA